MADLYSRADGHAKQINIGGDSYAIINVSESTQLSMVVVGDIPRQPLEFVNRVLLEDLRNTLETPSNSSVCVLTGMRGAGKTQIAAAYAREAIGSGHGVVGWVNADTNLDLLSGLTRVAKRLGISDQIGDTDEVARSLREYLASLAAPKLLVFDNASDPDIIAPYLNSLGSTRVLITSTDRRFAEVGTAFIHVGGYGRAESVHYLNSRTGLCDERGANSLAEELGDLPLALAASAATISARRLSYADYLALLKKQPVAKVLPRTDGQPYPISTETALLLALKSVQKHDRYGLITRLLIVMSMLSPQGVGTRILHRLTPGVTNFGKSIIFHTFMPNLEGDEDEIAEIIGHNAAELVLGIIRSDPEELHSDPLSHSVPDGSDSGLLDDAIELCNSGSVLSYSTIGTDVIMHRLTARVIRESLIQRGNERGSDLAFQMALDVVEPDLDITPTPDASPNDIANAAIHIDALWNNARAHVHSRELIRRAVEIRDSAVILLSMHSIDSVRAIHMGKNAVAEVEALFGADDSATRTVRRGLAFAYLQSGEPLRTIQLVEQNIADAERLAITGTSDQELDLLLLSRARDACKQEE